jgi:predicted permease
MERSSQPVAQWSAWFEDFVQDVHFSLRSMTRVPGFTMIHISLIAVSIGLACTAYSVLETVLLRSLPGVVEPDRLVMVSGLGSNDDRIGQPLRIYEYLRRLQDGTSHIFAYRNYGALPATIGSTTSAVRGIGVVDDYFGGLGRVPLIMGHPFDTSRNDPVAIISYGLWQNRFGGAPDVLSRTMVLGSVTFSVVGVAESDFLGTQPDLRWDIITTLDVLNRARGIAPGALADQTVYTVARLKAGVSPAQYQANVAAVWPRILEATVPPKMQLEEWTRRRGARPIVESFRRGQTFTVITTPGLPRALILTIGLSLLTFLASGVTLALLAVSRGIRNQQHTAIKLALGGTRWRLIRPYVMEAAVVSGLGCAVGLLITLWGISIGRDFVPGDWPIAVRRSTVILAAIMSVAVFGMGWSIAAYLASKASVREILQTANRSAQAHVKLRSILLASQFAISLILVCATLFYVEDLRGLATVNVGLNVSNLHVYSLAGRLPQRMLNTDYFERLQAELKTIPGVESAAVGGTAPPLAFIRDLTEPIQRKNGTPTNAFVSCMFPGVFATWGSRLVMGRDLGWTDPPGAVITQGLAKKLFPNENPLGQTIRRGRAESHDLEIVGVVDDMAYNGPRLGMRDVVFMSCLEYVTPWPSSNVTQIYIRSSRRLSELEPDVSKVVDRIGIQYIYDRADEEEYLGWSMDRERMLATVGGAFGGMILLLTGVGLYAFCSYLLIFRHRELAIRAALGAGTRDIAHALFTELIIVMAIGVGAGLVMTFVLNRAVGSVIVDVGTIRIRHSLEATLVLMLISAVALAAPMRRARRMNLARALRVD